MTAPGGAVGTHAAATDAGADSMRRRIVGLCRYKMQASPKFINLVGLAERGEANAKIVQRMVDRGLMTWWDGGGRPKPTILGRSLIMGAQLGITFLDACILSVIYRYARMMSGAKPGDAAPASNMRAITVPLKTIQNYLIDWPCGEPMIGKSISRLRAAGLLPRASNRRVICDLKHLAGVHDSLVELNAWVERTSEEMRMMLITPRAQGAAP
ncbi:MAG: hypothetical protein J4F28_08285 [Nitrosopumilaceae archaeon]|nr:hypothetical protein [Nitrosopumilaceae archaeon]